MSPGNVAREGIPFELFRSTYPGRHVARETYPQRQVARDTPDLSLGNMANVVVVSFNQMLNMQNLPTQEDYADFWGGMRSEFCLDLTSSLSDWGWLTVVDIGLGRTSVLCRSKERRTTTTFSMEVFDNELVPSSVPQIAPILRVANEFQSRRPCFAFLCRQYALEIANSLDESSSGPGVRHCIL
ncbi:callose synthase 5 [Tanacetum coccineum]